MSAAAQYPHAPGEKTAMRANPDIGYKLVDGAMSFLTRKLYNALIFHAQRLGTARKGEMPVKLDWDIAESVIDPSKYFWVPLSELSADSACGNDYKALKGWLHKMQKISVMRGTSGAWESEQIISKIAMVNTASPTPRAREGRWLVGWRFPEDLEGLLLDPEEYTPICLYYQSLMTSESALALYEIARRYASWRFHKTMDLPWEEWQALLVAESTPRKEYRFFKRDFLMPAIEQINQRTDVEIEVVERKRPGSRAVENLWFSVDLKKQGRLELPGGPPIPSDLLQRMDEIGISNTAAEQLLSEHGEERVRANIDLFMSHPKDKGAGWLIAAIRDDYASGEQKKKAAKIKLLASAQTANKQVIAASSKEVEQQTNAVKVPSGDELLQKWTEFKAIRATKAIFKRVSPATYEEASAQQKKAFTGWLASQA